MIIRTEKNKNYTVMSNYHLRDKRLSNKAKGLMSYMLSCDDKWTFSVDGLSMMSADKRDGIRTQLKELEAFGYLTKGRKRDENGRLGDAEYTLYEKPVLENPTPKQEKPTLEKPTLEKPTLEKPTLEKPTLRNTNTTNTKERITNGRNTNSASAPSAEIPLTVNEYFSQFADFRKKMRKPLTPYAAKLLLHKLHYLSNGDQGKAAAIVNQSIMNGWQGLFPLKSDNYGKVNSMKAAIEAFKRQNEEDLKHGIDPTSESTVRDDWMFR